VFCPPVLLFSRRKKKKRPFCLFNIATQGVPHDISMYICIIT
jgi:hypothetical protein